MILVNLLGLLLIGLIAWWFWFYKPVAISMGDRDSVVIVDSGSYSPAHITLAANQPTTMTFLRKDASPCAEVLIIPSLDLNKVLPLNQTVTVELPALTPGEYPFYCQMQMYRGMLNVRPLEN